MARQSCPVPERVRIHQIPCKIREYKKGAPSLRSASLNQKQMKNALLHATAKVIPEDGDGNALHHSKDVKQHLVLDVTHKRE